jgi:hypothetical protein
MAGMVPVKLLPWEIALQPMMVHRNPACTLYNGYFADAGESPIAYYEYYYLASTQGRGLRARLNIQRRTMR